MKSDSVFGLLTVGGIAALVGLGVVQQKRLARLEEGQAFLARQLTSAAARPAARPSAAAALAAPTALPAEPIGIAGAASRGADTAKLVMVEFSDFECPFCGRYVRDTYPQIGREYVDTGKIRYVFRHFPIESLHPHAFRAAEAGECARSQGRFWELHDRLFANQKALTEADLLKQAGAVGLNAPAFKQCVEGPAQAKIRTDLADGARAGISGTPMFFLGVADGAGRIRARKVISGAEPYAVFKSAIDEQLVAIAAGR